MTIIIRGEAQVEVVQALATQGRLDRALATAREIRVDTAARVRALGVIASFSTQTERELIVREALDHARATKHSHTRITALAPIIPQVPAILLSETLRITQWLGDAYHQAMAVSSLAGLLSDPGRSSVMEMVVTAIGRIEYGSAFSGAVWELLPFIPDVLLPQLVDSARTTQDLFFGASTLMDLSSRLAGSELDLLREAWAMARRVSYAPGRTRLLTELSVHMPDPEKAIVLREAAQAAREIRPTCECAEALAKVAQRLQGEEARVVFAEALSAAREPLRTEKRIQALTVIAAHLPPEQQNEILLEAKSEAQHVRDTGERWRCFEALVRGLRRMHRYEEAVSVARAYKRPLNRIRLLGDLVETLEEEERAVLLREAAEAAAEVKSPALRAQTFARLAAQCPLDQRSDLLEQAYQTALQIPDVGVRDGVLTGIGEQMMQHGRVDQALQVAGDVKGGYARCLLEVQIVRGLIAAGRTAEGLELARGIACSYESALALRELSRLLAEEDRPAIILEVLSAARRIETGSMRASTLRAIANDIADYCERNGSQLWVETLKRLCARSREDLLQDLGALSPVIARLGGANAVIEVAHAIDDVGRWWP